MNTTAGICSTSARYRASTFALSFADAAGRGSIVLEATASVEPVKFLDRNTIARSARIGGNPQDVDLGDGHGAILSPNTRPGS